MQKKAKDEKNGKKIAESAYFGTQYLLLSLVAVFLIVDQKLLTSKAIYRDKLNDTPTKVQTIYMMLEFGIYLAGSIFLFFETRSKNADFGIMVVHHIVTITLLIMGWTIKLFNYSIMIAALHDVSDIILEYSKVFYYSKWKKTSNAIFCFFAAVFISTRLYFFPKHFIAPWYNG